MTQLTRQDASAVSAALLAFRVLHLGAPSSALLPTFFGGVVLGE